MIASAQTLAILRPVSPFRSAYHIYGMSGGLGPAGYDIAVANRVVIGSRSFVLSSSLEQFFMPNNLFGVVHDKSTWARLGLAVQNTVIEPGWRGFLTLEFTNHSDGLITIEAETPVAQVVFHLLDKPTDSPYNGKYQDQESGPQEARKE